MTRSYIAQTLVKPDELRFTLGERQGKPLISATMGANFSEIAFVTEPAVTLWPRCTGDGNFGSMWGPSEVSKAKYTLDLTDTPIKDTDVNTGFEALRQLMDAIDDRLLDFVYANQLKILGRKNLSRDEVKMLQIRTVRPKYDKLTGAVNGHSMNLSAAKFAWNGVGGKQERKINICDCQGRVLTDGIVCPGDVVAVTIYANQVYTGVGGDKFGVHWSFEDVSVVCQRAKLAQKSSVPAFCAHQYSFATPYTDFSEVVGANEQAGA